MSSAFDKSPHQPEDDGGREDTTAYGQPVPPPPGYGQAGHGQPGQPGDQYGQQGGYPPGPQYPYPPGYGFAAPDHPKASTSMVLGILGVVLCQVLAPFAWIMGKRTVQEIDASGGRWGGRGQAQAGYVLGIVGTVILALSLAFLLIYVVVAVIALGGFAASAG